MSSRSGGNELALALSLEGRAQPASPEVARLVALAETLAGLPDPLIDPKFAARLEARLMEEELAEEQNRALRVAPKPSVRPAEPVRRAKVHPLPRRRVVIRRGLIAAALAVMLMALPIAASAGALPGSPFYSLKLGIERIELAFAGGPEAKAFKHLELAGTRLDEAAQLVALGRGDAVSATLDRMAAEQRTGTTLILGFPAGRPAVTRAAQILRTQTAGLSALAAKASPELRAAVLDAAAASDALATRLASALSATASTRQVARTLGAAVGHLLGSDSLAQVWNAQMSSGGPQWSDAPRPPASSGSGPAQKPGGNRSYGTSCLGQAVGAAGGLCEGDRELGIDGILGVLTAGLVS